jgi:hypothetical protein
MRKSISLHLVAFVALTILLSACATPTPRIVRVEVTATVTPGPSPTPPPTWTPTPTPTPTPIPPAYLEVLVPEIVSPLDPMVVEAVFVPPEGVASDVYLSATVMDPVADVYATFDLSDRVGGHYQAPDLLYLPLEPLAGYWWVIVHAETSLSVEGTPARFFEIAPLSYHTLTDTLPSGVSLRVPVDFQEVVSIGDQAAGGRVWQYEDGEVALWWAPGAAEELSLSNALVALETTYAAEPRELTPPRPTTYIETQWQGLPAFEFPETWPGETGGPATAWVIQDPDHWLYILRVRAIGVDPVPRLHRDVVETFSLASTTD